MTYIIYSIVLCFSVVQCVNATTVTWREQRLLTRRFAPAISSKTAKASARVTPAGRSFASITASTNWQVLPAPALSAAQRTTPQFSRECLSTEIG